MRGSDQVSVEPFLMRSWAVLMSVVVVLAGSQPAPAAGEGCDRRVVRIVVRDFIDAYNRGDIAVLDRMFPSQEEFGQYRAWPEREWPESDDRATLMDYFEKRHEYGDRLKIEELNLSSRRSPDGSCGMGYVFRRVSDDPLPWGDGRFSGKGGVLPVKGQVFSINMSWGP